MAITAPSAGHSSRIDGTLIHEIAKERVAAREGTLNEVRGEIKLVTQQLFAGQLRAEDMDAVDLPVPVGDDDGSDESDDDIASQDDLVADAGALHEKDVQNAVGRTDVHLTKEPEHVLGHSDGDDAYVDLHNGINPDTVKHEFQHVEDGAFMHAAGDLDTGIAQDAVQDLPNTLAAEIDEEDEALQLTARAVLEKRATVAGGSAPESYKQEFVNPYDRVSQRMEKAGIDADAVFNRLVDSRDIEGYKKAVRTMVAYEALDLAA